MGRWWRWLRREVHLLATWRGAHLLATRQAARLLATRRGAHLLATRREAHLLATGHLPLVTRRRWRRLRREWWLRKSRR